MEHTQYVYIDVDSSTRDVVRSIERPTAGDHHMVAANLMLVLKIRDGGVSRLRPDGAWEQVREAMLVADPDDSSSEHAWHG